MATCVHCGELFEGGSSGEKPVCVKCRQQFAFPPAKPQKTVDYLPEADEDFDAYYTWLGIPPAKQPPNHYQLLGLVELEGNATVIASAADRQSIHLRSLLGSEHAHHAERLLAEVDAARVCLLNESTKSAYDQVLAQAIRPQPVPTQQTATQTTQVPQPTSSVPVLAPATSAAPKPSPVSTPVKTAQPKPMLDSTPVPRSVQRDSTSKTARRRSKPKKSPVTQLVQIVLGGIAGCAIGYYLGFVLLPQLRESSQPPQQQRPAIVYSRQDRSKRSTPMTRRLYGDQPTATNAHSSPANRPYSASNNWTVTRPPTSAQSSQSGTIVSPSSPTGNQSNRSSSGTSSNQARPANRTSTRSGSGSSLPAAFPPRTLDSLLPKTTSTSTTSILPPAFVLPKRGSSLAKDIFDMPTTFRITAPMLLADAAGLQDGEYLYLEEAEDAGTRSWTVCTAIPEADNPEAAKPREIAEFSEIGGELTFRWFSQATAEDEALLLNSMLQLSDDKEHLPVALREPENVSAMDFDMNERRVTHTFSVPDVPAEDRLMLELAMLTDFPSRARFDDNVREIQVGRSTKIVFDDVPGAELEIKFQDVTDKGLTISVASQFRENSATVVAMTKPQLETTLRSLEKTIARTEADIRSNEAALSRLRSQSTSNLNGAQAAGLAGLINKTQSRVNADQRKLIVLRSKLANGPTIETLLDALHHRPTLPFRIVAVAGSNAKITLIDGEWLP